MLTKEEYDKLPEDTIFRTGISTNSMSGINMASSYKDRQLLWIAKKRPDGWCIYTHWRSEGIDFVETNGDKVTSEVNIKGLVPCDNEVFELYVY